MSGGRNTSSHSHGQSSDNSEPPRSQVEQASRPSAIPGINNSFVPEQAMGGMPQQDFGLDGMMQHFGMMQHYGMMQHFGMMQPYGEQFAYTPRQT
jgi:hypothetical protein